MDDNFFLLREQGVALTLSPFTSRPRKSQLISLKSDWKNMEAYCNMPGNVDDDRTDKTRRQG
ncbi:MAG: hypothetical protein WCD81_01555 [Candidatus Bathyarchaeia archaeon]